MILRASLHRHDFLETFGSYFFRYFEAPHRVVVVDPYILRIVEMDDGDLFPSFDIALASRNGRQPAYAITSPSRPYSDHSSLTVSGNKNFVVIAVEFLTPGIENWKQEFESPTHLARTSYGIRTIFPRKSDVRKPNAVLDFARLDDLT